MWNVIYTHDRAAGVRYTFAVEAADAEVAVMRAGMARAESFVGWFTKRFYGVVRWHRVAVERAA